LVDRIVTGFEPGHGDKLLVTGERFALWVIESDAPETVSREFPLDKAGLPVIFTDDLTPYRERKVRLLNGAHTSTVAAGLLAGLDTVGELMEDNDLRKLLEHNVYKELAPYVPLPADEVEAFASSVIDRFQNPYIRHELKSIALNSVSKWKSRVLPTVEETFKETGHIPNGLSFSLAALIEFYSGGFTMDDKEIIEFFAESKALPPDALAAAFLNRQGWDDIPGFTEKIAGYVTAIREKGVRAAIGEVTA
jgi:tagaturonate reductase